MIARALPGVVGLALLALGAAGCGGSAATAGGIPESASLAPSDALLYATLSTDEESEQWGNAEQLLERIPGAREGLVEAVTSALQEEGLSWDEDVAPAVGPEVVIVVSAAQRPIVLTKPDSEAKLDALLARGDDPPVKGSVEGWTALAERDADLAAYRASLEKGTLEDVEAFTDGLGALPEDALARVWVDVATLSKDLDRLIEEASTEIDLGLDWMAASLAAEDDGLLVAMGMRTPGGGDTSYEPELFDGVPADSVLALSFGGTQSTLDRIQDSVDVDDLSRQIEDVTGVSLEGLVDALSGEGVLYTRDGGEVPEVTLVLAPPDPDETWATLERLARTVVEESGATAGSRTENGLEVNELTIEDVTLSYARLDGDTMIVTTGEDAIPSFTGDGEKLRDTDDFERAADAVGMEERTRGFAYVDFDGLLELVEGLAGEDGLPSDAQDAIASLDSFIMEASGEGDTTEVSGFLRLSD